jgi:hypothetical protein
MSRGAGVPRKSSTAERSGMRTPALRKNWHGKRDQNDCGPEHHQMILHLFEFHFLRLF